MNFKTRWRRKKYFRYLGLLNALLSTAALLSSIVRNVVAYAKKSTKEERTSFLQNVLSNFSLRYLMFREKVELETFAERVT